MERFLLINNKTCFDSNNIHTVTSTHKDAIPNRNCILFIGSHTRSLDNLNHVQKYFDAIREKAYGYIILVGKGDGILNNNLNIPCNVKYIYATNTNFKHDKIKFLPMGCDFRSIKSFSKANINNNKRDILCYCNFSLNTHSSRNHVYDLLKNKSFITIENMGEFLNYSISRDEFFKKLGTSKFVLCPRGNAMDTFRLYDTIYAGAIPIVVKETFHDSSFFQGIPILYLENNEAFKNLTESFLNEKYDELVKYKKTYYEGLDFKAFIHKLTVEF